MRCALALFLFGLALEGAQLPPGVRFLPGPVNGLLIGQRILVYGDSGSRVQSASHVLFTHARRDVAWAGVRLVGRGAAAIVPEKERELFEDPAAFWKSYETARFHDYSQINTKVLRAAMPVARAVRGGESLHLDGVRIEVIDTPGYSRGAVSYIVHVAGKRIACTGDLIYGPGQLLELSSLQDAIPEAKTRGYHGYAARAADLLESLRRIAAHSPDLIVPARGKLITDPPAAIDALIARLQSLMASHFATDALRWYWGEESLRLRSRRILESRAVDSMPMAQQRPLPPWAMAVGNSRVILSGSGAALVIDAGHKALAPKLEEMSASGALKSVDAIWITHYHDDHTDYAQSIAGRFHSPVWFTPALQEILERPSTFRLPCLTQNSISAGKPRPPGTTARWREFKLTFYDFPGQTLYHSGLLVERDGGDALFFAGDSFTPSGIDDYCLQNRNFLGEDQGFLSCLRVLDQLPPNVWLVNQHVEPTFRFTAEQVARMRAELRKRSQLIAELAPWPGPNYAVDESWAAIHPYAQQAREAAPVKLEFRIMNHSPRAETYTIEWNLPPGWQLVEADRSVRIPPGREAAARASFSPRGAGLHVVTANVAFSAGEFREWAEALVSVQSAR